MSKAPVEVKQNVKAVVLKREMTEAERKEHVTKIIDDEGIHSRTLY